MYRAALLITLLSCGGTTKPPQTEPEPKQQPDPWHVEPLPGPTKPSNQEILATLSKFDDEMCKCQDEDCFELIIDARNKYVSDLAMRYGAAGFDAEFQSKANEHKTTFGECVNRALKVIKFDAGRVPLRPTGKMKVQHYMQLRDETCACTDKQCIARTGEARQRYIDENGHIPFSSKEDEERALQLIIEMGVCAAKVNAR